MADKFGIRPDKASTPLPTKNLHASHRSPPVDNKEYRSIIGAILYVSVATRPDIAFAISLLSQFSEDPREIHKDAALRLMRYLLNTAHYKIHYDGTNQMTGYADASQWK